MPKALIAMSGGVDSAVAALLTREAGYECIGCTMRLYRNEDAGLSRGRTCCSLDDVEDARSVAYRLGMPYYVFNFTDDFREKVIDKFIHCYACGMTPNPCIDCNRYMKFEKLFDRARILGCDRVVTGHYARIERAGDKFVLKKAVDESKDQSYVLYSMTQEQLAHTLFPLGSMRKTETRALAHEWGFCNAEKPDSQDICFVPDGDYAQAIERLTGKVAEPGYFTDVSGRVLGEHRGIIRYTVGQRRGLGIAAKEPLYVVRIDPRTNTVVLGGEKELYTRDVTVAACHWIAGEAPAEPIRCTAKLRYRQAEQPATATARPDGSVVLHFDAPQRAVAPGQAAVLYDKETVLGGGIIVSRDGQEP